MQLQYIGVCLVLLFIKVSIQTKIVHIHLSPEDDEEVLSVEQHTVDESSSLDDELVTRQNVERPYSYEDRKLDYSIDQRANKVGRYKISIRAKNNDKSFLREFTKKRQFRKCKKKCLKTMNEAGIPQEGNILLRHCEEQCWGFWH